MSESMILEQYEINLQALRKQAFEDARRVSHERINRAFGESIGIVASQVAASFLFHPDPKIAGRMYAKWSAIAMMAPLVSCGMIPVAAVAAEASRE